MRETDDPRIPLEPGESPVPASPPIRIERLIARGTSCLVYRASRGSGRCTVKQLYPEGMAHRAELSRINGKMRLACTLPAMVHMLAAKRRFRFAYRVQRRLRRNPRLQDRIVAAVGLLKQGSAWYMLSSADVGIAWDRLQGERAEQILQIGITIAKLLEELHACGWLMIDVKASNFLVEYREDDRIDVRMADFDSLVRRRVCRFVRRYHCSNETAPPELLQGRRSAVGGWSDVYGVGALLLNKLASIPVQQPIDAVFDSRVRPRLAGWSEARATALYAVLRRATAPCPEARYATCRALADALDRIRDMKNWGEKG